jgi:hypothetical protein
LIIRAVLSPPSAAGFIIDSGVRQFLDLGSGIPVAGNPRETVRGVVDALPHGRGGRKP